MANEIRQGEILSPILFNIYINDFSDIFNKFTVGGSFRGIRINLIKYAEKLCIVRPSSAGLQQLLAQCDDYRTNIL